MNDHEFRKVLSFAVVFSLFLAIILIILPSYVLAQSPIDPYLFWCANERYLYYNMTLYKDCSAERGFCCQGLGFCKNQSACCLPYRCEITPSPCVGTITELRLNPNPSIAGEKTNAMVTFTGNCGGRRVEIREGSCKTEKLACSCTLPLIPRETFCYCSFNAPSVGGNYTYYACIDLNADGDFEDRGESASTVLKVVSKLTTTTTRPPISPPPPPTMPPVESSEYTVTLNRGWNLVSFPFKKYILISVSQSVYPTVYSYNSVEGRYEVFNLATEYEKLRLRGFWVYSFEDNQHIVISGSEPFLSFEINLYANLSRTDTPNQIAIPIRGIRLNSEKGSCEITRFYYWNSSDNTWYRWNATTGEYSRYNSEKRIYELIKVDKDPFIASGVSIFLYVRKNCTLGISPPPPPEAFVIGSK